MPPKRKYAQPKYASRKRSKKYKKRSSMSQICRQGGFVVAKRQIVTLKYFLQLTLPQGGAVGVASKHTLRCNSIFDPSVTDLTGTQPTGHDEWSEFYRYYRVDRCKISATFFDHLDVDNLPHSQGIIGIRKGTANDSITTLGYAAVMANNLGRTTWKYASVPTAGKGQQTVTNTFRVSDTGVSRNDVSSWTEFGSNPDEAENHWNFEVFTAPVSPSTLAGSRQVTVQMWFTCTLKERKALSLS